MSELRKQAADALRPFAELAALVDGLAPHMREDGYSLLSLGGPRATALRVHHLRAAAKCLAALEAPPEQG